MLTLILLLGSVGASAEILKCTMPDGEVVYTNQGCSDQTSQVTPLQLTDRRQHADQRQYGLRRSTIQDTLKFSPVLAVCLYLTMSIVSFFLYWTDKRRAVRHEWRVHENTLHFSDLIGGWPGGRVAQRMFRHKTRKIKFQRIYWLTVVTNITLSVYWFLGFPDVTALI